MLHHSISDVRILARAYLDATGVSARALSLEITQSSGNSTYSEKLIQRLLDGKSCKAESLELASNWLKANWPESAAWPLEPVRHVVDKLKSAAE